MIKLLPGLKPYTLSLFLVIIFLLAQSLAELYLPTLMSDPVDEGSGSNLIEFMQRIVFYLGKHQVASISTETHSNNRG